MKPERGRVVHCKREAYDVYIGRPSEWGNPFTHQRDTLADILVASRQDAVAAYREFLRNRVRSGEPGLVEKLAALHGKTLGCWCAPQACHGDVLLDAAEWAYDYLEET